MLFEDLYEQSLTWPTSVWKMVLCERNATKMVGTMDISSSFHRDKSEETFYQKVKDKVRSWNKKIKRINL